MTSELSINSAIAYCALRRNGELRRVSVAAPLRGGYLLLQTCDRALLDGRGDSARDGMGLLPLIDELAIPGHRIHPHQQFICPVYSPPVAGEPTRVQSGPLVNPQDVRGRLTLDGRGQWSMGGKAVDLAPAPPGMAHIWSCDHVTGVWWPIAVPRGVADAISRLESTTGRIEIQKAVHQVITNLCSGAVIAPPSSSKTPSLVDMRVPAIQLPSLLKYYGQLRKCGAMRLGDRDSTHRAWMNEDRVSRVLLMQYAPYLSRILGVKLTPHFSHFVSYLPQANLPAHLDKDPSVYSVSVQLGYFNRGVAVRNGWRFSVEDSESGVVRHFTPDEGLGVVFRGGREKHMREEIPDGHCSDVVLFHYLSAEPP